MLRKAESIAQELCTPLPGNGPLAATLENVTAAVEIAQQDALEASIEAIARVPRDDERYNAGLRQAALAIRALLESP